VAAARGASSDVMNSDINLGRRNTAKEFANLFQFCPQSSVVGIATIATSTGLDNRGVGVRVLIGSEILSSPRRPDRFWGPPSLLSDGYREHFLRG
jgi:hypothetical protein